MTKAEHLHRRLIAAYSVCDRYTDQGHVDGPLGRHWFTTDYQRPEHLSFLFGEWQGEHRVEQFRLEHSKGQTTVWRARDGVTEPFDSLSLAVAALTGVTSGVAHRVPALLMPSLGGRTLCRLAELNVVASETVNSVDCSVVEGVYPDRLDCVERLWIGITVPFLARAVTEVREKDLQGTFVSDYLARGV